MNEPRVDEAVLVCTGQDKAPVPQSSPVFRVPLSLHFICGLRYTAARWRRRLPGITVPTSPAEEAAEHGPRQPFSARTQREHGSLEHEQAARWDTKSCIRTRVASETCRRGWRAEEAEALESPHSEWWVRGALKTCAPHPTPAAPSVKH